MGAARFNPASLMLISMLMFAQQKADSNQLSLDGNWEIIFDDKNEGVEIRVIFNMETEIRWLVKRNGLVYYHAKYRPKGNMRNFGIDFSYPEENIISMEWFGKGPYRVWKNRMKGTSYDIWKKEYNNTMTGESYEDLTYPEFKGYHANLYWVAINTTESPFYVFCASEDIFLRMLTPETKSIIKGVKYDFPEVLHYFP